MLTIADQAKTLDDARVATAAVQQAFPNNRVIILGSGCTLDTHAAAELRQTLAALDEREG